MEKILTIIVPTYNMEEYLNNTLQSLVVSPSLMSILEVLVVNDGSKDSSSEIAHNFADKYPNTFRAIDKENGNYGSCINRGLKEAKGKYIKILDADDSFNNSAFSQYLTEIKTLDVDAIFNDADIVNADGHILRNFWIPANPNQVFNFFEKQINPEMHTIAYRTENLRKIGYKQTEGISYTDQEWVFMPIVTIHSAYYCKIPLYRYLIGREGQTMDHNVLMHKLEQLLSVAKSMVKAFEKEDKLPYSEWMENKVTKYLLFLYRFVLIENEKANDSRLIQFDKELIILSPFLFNKTNEANIDNIFIYKYIFQWRKKYNLNYNSFIIALYEKIYKFKIYHALLKLVSYLKR